MPQHPERQRFSVDIQGLLAALTEQFPEPLLCVRELVQNAADAEAKRIQVDASYDEKRALFRLAVQDDGRGMSAAEIEGYLTIGFSEKDPNRDRGRFGVGKLSPYALGIRRMQVETCDGRATHRLTFNGDGSGTIDELPPDRPRGTVVRVYKACTRGEAELLAARTRALVEERCGSLGIPLFVNGQPVNREVTLGTPYVHRFSFPIGTGVIGVAADPIRALLGGGIVLETDAAILGNEISYLLDSPRLSPTLSRNSVRRDGAFDASLRAAQAQLPALNARVAEELMGRVSRARQRGEAVERTLDPNDRAAMEWLRQQLLRPDDVPPDPAVRAAPVLETADGGLVSADELVEVIRRENRVPASRVPRTREEIGAYADRGLPVLLLYRDLEDFLERQEISTVEVDGQDDGIEISRRQWTPGEVALATRSNDALSLGRPAPRRRRLYAGGAMALATALLIAVSPHFAAPPPPLAPVELAHAAPPRPAPVRPTEATAIAELPRARRLGRPLMVGLAGVLALLSASAGLGLVYLTFQRKHARAVRWLRAEVGAPLTIGEAGLRRFDVLRRAFCHPIDFLVARGWSIRAAGDRSLSASSAIQGYRELSPERPIRSGVRLDLDRISIGFVDLISSVGEPHDGRVLIRRDGRVLLNRNHPTVRDLIAIAERAPAQAQVLLDIMLATDAELSQGTDPRQVEWDLLGRAESSLRAAS